MNESLDASGRLTIHLADEGPMFSTCASRLESICNARRLQRLDDMDQSYWEHEVEGATVVLHSNVFAGISIHMEDSSGNELLRRIAVQIS